MKDDEVLAESDRWNTSKQYKDEWYNGEVWCFDKRDFKGRDPHRFRNTLIAVAVRKGMRTESRAKDGKLYFRATPRTEDKVERSS